MLADMGVTAFLSECQQDVSQPIGGMFNHIAYKRLRREDVPDLVRTVCWVDPAVSTTDQSDSMGIQVDGIDPEGVIYRLFSWEGRTTPTDVLRRAILAAEEYGCEHVGVETDQGGDTWQSVYREAWHTIMVDRSGRQVPPRFKSAKAGAGHGPKAHRASLMVPDYERGRIVHVIGTHHVLERALGRFPLKKPYDLVDASYWSWRELRPARSKRMRVS
jgi:phage terminase large subunit-like protein